MNSSDLGKYGCFVALIQILAKQLSPSAESLLQPVVGETYQHPGPLSIQAGQGDITVMGPMNEPVQIARSVNADQLSVQISQTKRPGFYHFMRDENMIASVAMNVDKREHDLSRIDRDSLLQQFETEGLQLDVQTADGWEPLSNLRGSPCGLVLHVRDGGSRAGAFVHRYLEEMRWIIPNWSELWNC